MDQGFEFALGEEAFGEGFDVGKGDVLGDGKLFAGLEIEFAHVTAGSFADEQMGIGEWEVLQAANESVLEGLKAFFVEIEIDETLGEDVEETVGRGVVAADTHLDAIEAGGDCESESGVARGVGGFVEGLVDGGLVEVEQDGVLQGAEGAREAEVIDLRDHGAEEFGVLCVEQAESRFVDELHGLDGQHVGAVRNKRVRFRKVEVGDGIGLEEGGVGVSGFFGVAEFGAVVGFDRVGGQAFGDERNEGVVGTQMIEDKLVAGGVGVEPKVGFTFSDGHGDVAELIGEEDGAVGPVALVGKHLVELGHGAAFFEQVGGVTSGFDFLDCAENELEDARVIFETGGRETDADIERAEVGGVGVGAGAEAGGESFCLEDGKETAGALVAEDRAEEFTGLAGVKLASRREREFECERA